MHLGPPRYFKVRAPREHWRTPGVWEYVECDAGDTPIYVERMNMQGYVHRAFVRLGQLWEKDAILLKIAEELGELVREFRKGTKEGQEHEYGDLLFSVLALGERVGIDSTDQLCKAVYRFEQHCESLARIDSRAWLKQRGEEDEVSETKIPLPDGECSACHQPINGGRSPSGLCPDCYLTRRALAGHGKDFGDQSSAASKE